MKLAALTTCETFVSQKDGAHGYLQHDPNAKLPSGTEITIVGTWSGSPKVSFPGQFVHCTWDGGEGWISFWYLTPKVLSNLFHEACFFVYLSMKPPPKKARKKT